MHTKKLAFVRPQVNLLRKKGQTQRFRSIVGNRDGLLRIFPNAPGPPREFKKKQERKKEKKENTLGRFHGLERVFFLSCFSFNSHLRRTRGIVAAFSFIY